MLIIVEPFDVAEANLFSSIKNPAVEELAPGEPLNWLQTEEYPLVVKDPAPT